MLPPRCRNRRGGMRTKVAFDRTHILCYHTHRTYILVKEAFHMIQTIQTLIKQLNDRQLKLVLAFVRGLL